MLNKLDVAHFELQSTDTLNSSWNQHLAADREAMATHQVEVGAAGCFTCYRTDIQNLRELVVS